MKIIQQTILTLALITITSCQTVPWRRDLASQYHISESAQQLVYWETKANGISTRSNELIRVEHYEIPLRLLEQDFESSLDSNIKKSLFFTKNGETYVRWLINPEDSKWHLEIKEFLKKHKLDSEPKKFFDGYLTASRSMILVNPENGASFSLKVSTDKTGGKWTDKKQTWKDAKQVRKMSRYVKESLPKVEAETLVIMDEPLALGIKDLDQGMILRSLNDLPEDGHYYLPAFSALHETEGLRIAKLNGASDPVRFWEKNLNEPIAKAMAEYFAATGSWYDSPHAQNFLVELDRDMKPTGRIVLRDLGDSYILEDFIKNTQFSWVIKDWDPNFIQQGKITTGVGLLHGNNPPSWMNGMDYKEFQWGFYRNFEKHFAEITGVPSNDLLRTESKEILWSYARKTYATTSPQWKKFIQYANCLNGERKTLAGENCPELYLKRLKKIDCTKAVNAILQYAH